MGEVKAITSKRAKRMETVYKQSGVRVVYLHGSDTFEVWAMVANGPDDFDWDVVDVFDSSDEAVDAAVTIADRMEMAELLT